MPREKTELKRKHKGDFILNINDLFRNPDIQKKVIKNINKYEKNKKRK